MARRSRDSALDSRSARSRLETRNAPYWSVISPGLAVGYRKGSRGGSWLVKFYDANTGKRLQDKLGTADDVLDPDGTAVLNFWQAQERARDWFADQARKLAGLEPVETATYTVADAFADYLKWMKRHRKTVVDTTYRGNAFIIPTLGELNAAQLTAVQLRRWHEELADKPPRVRVRKGQRPRYRKPSVNPDDIRRRRSSANRVLTILKACLNHAWREGKIASDTAWRRVRPFPEADAARIRHLTVEEARRLIGACEPGFRELVQAALLTGARFGELAALTTADFGPDRGTVHIRTSKSGKGRHAVLNDEGINLFKQLTAGRVAGEPIFKKPDGTGWGKSHHHRPFKAACSRAGIVPTITFHELRHTWASLSIMAGAPLLVVAQNLGHSDTRMVERHYGHLAESFVADTIRRTAPTFSVVT